MRPESDQVYFSNIAINKIFASKNNPRKVFDGDNISELAKSFSEYGIIQPIIVFKNQDRYVIICGERRWRAAKLAKIKKVPAIVHPTAPKDEIAVSMALIENLHRQNVDLVSESTAIQSLVNNFNWDKNKIAEELGISIAYIRNRLLLTKFDDVLAFYNKKQASFSEAIELASLGDKESRYFFMERIKNKGFRDHKDFLIAISRHKNIQKIITKGYFLNQPLLDKDISFFVKDLPYCDSQCKNYLKLTWEEKKRFKVKTNKSGWSEYCVELDCSCYLEKKAVKKKHQYSLKKVNLNRPIPYDGWESMQWLNYRNKSCNSCRFFISSSDFEQAGILIDKNVHSYCISSDGKCYTQRQEVYIKAGLNREKKIEADKVKKKQAMLKQISENKSFPKNSNNSYITKVESAYLIISFLCYAGGNERIKNFAEKHSIKKLPSSYAAQVTYIRNKLINKFKEEQLMEILFSEALASAAFSPQKIEPRGFDRKMQKEILINDTSHTVKI